RPAAGPSGRVAGASAPVPRWTSSRSMTCTSAAASATTFSAARAGSLVRRAAVRSPRWELRSSGRPLPGSSGRRSRRAGSARPPLLGRARERMMDGAVAALLLVPLEHREVGDPEEAPGVLVDQAELAAELQPQLAQRARDLGRLVRAEEERRPGLAAERRELALR